MFNNNHNGSNPGSGSSGNGSSSHIMQIQRMVAASRRNAFLNEVTFKKILS